MRRVLLALGVLMGAMGCDQGRADEVRVIEAQADPLEVALAGGRTGEVAIGELRAEGREGFGRVLAAYRDPAREGAAADWDRVLDRVAGQRDAAASGLFWEMHLEAALAAARERDVPVLSLRLLGDLRDELSCANSRFFRTLLYSDPELARFLDENFVMHWSSERAVPKVTIDFGDGRRITTTTTGNSAHYVLDQQGRVLDVLPGLYDPKTFRARLAEIVSLHRAIEGAPSRREDEVREHHRRAVDRIEARTSGSALSAWMRRPPGGRGDAPVPALAAQPIAISKSRVETPVLRGIEELEPPPTVDVPAEVLQRMAQPLELSPAAIAMIRRDRPQRPDETDAAYAERIEALVAKTADDLALDTFVNEARLHYQIHQWYLAGEVDGDFTTLDDRVYRELFATPRGDPWIGLRDDASYDGLSQGPHRVAG